PGVPARTSDSRRRASFRRTSAASPRGADVSIDPAVPETPEELYARGKEALRMPPVEEWEQWPFEGALRPRPLQPPEAREGPRFGEGGVDCSRCAAPDADYIWTNERWRLWPFTPPNGLPLAVLLEPREHYAEPGDLPDELAAELGILQARIERAIRGLGN